MKYIRTKDGKIYDLESKKVSSWEYIDNDTAINEYGVECAFYSIYYFDEYEGHYSEYDGKGGHSCDFIEEKDILKQADTIGELCDRFVNVSKCSKNITITGIYQVIGCSLKQIKGMSGEIYGAIWTSKGLIFVAKMNEKGDLELWD
ncbi:MAG: hypothetical protein IKF82_00965 [Bacilli bacterium]|nr:hypothetical protein [Bacilli bacterium]